MTHTHDTTDATVQESAADDRDALPEYAVEMAAFHRGFAAELNSLIDRLPIRPDDAVLDVGCGDGFYVDLLAARLGPAGRIVGVDLNTAFLDVARSRPAPERRCRTEFVEGSLDHLPDAVGTGYDVVWCAQSLYSFPDPEAAVRRLAAVAKPGGIVAVLENDTLHQVLLPWPIELELAIRTAEHAVFQSEVAQPHKYYVGRRLPELLSAGGLVPTGYRTQAIDRLAPLEPFVDLFLKRYFRRLLDRVVHHLPAAMAAEAESYLRADGENYLPRDPHFVMTWYNVLAWGRRDASDES